MLEHHSFLFGLNTSMWQFYFNIVCFNAVYLLFSSVTQSCPTFRPHGLQCARLPCPSVSLRVCSYSCQLSRWWYPNIPSSVIPFSFCLQSFQASESFPMSWLFSLEGQGIGASASISVLPMSIQGWFPLELTSLISLQSKGLSRVFSSPSLKA